PACHLVAPCEVHGVELRALWTGGRMAVGAGPERNQVVTALGKHPLTRIGNFRQVGAGFSGRSGKFLRLHESEWRNEIQKREQREQGQAEDTETGPLENTLHCCPPSPALPG